MMCPTIPPSEVNGMTDMSSTKGQRLHPVWFIRDTSIKDMVEFPKQTKGHMVDYETICSNTAKGQSSFKNPSFCTVSLK